MRQADRAMIEEFGIPGLLLMEHAARAVAEVAAGELAPRGTVVVICGTGNNAGDGWAAARLLHLGGHAVRVIPLREASQLHGDAGVMARAYEKVGGPLAALGPDLGAGHGDVVVDAIFGTGLDRAPEGIFHAAIEAIHAARLAGARVLAVDIPSGVSADTGRPFGIAVQADVTVTFAFLKRGLVLHPGAELAGRLQVADISIPPQVLVPLAPSVRLLDEHTVRRWLPPRPPDSHKGTFGHCLLIAGSEDRPGAAALAARGALAGGAGLVSVAARPGALETVLRHAAEVMGVPLPGAGPLTLDDLDPLEAALAGKAALLVGPGIPRDDATGGLITRLLEIARCPVVLDADALNAIAGRPGVIPRARHDVVVTPHPGEMARLTGLDTGQVQLDRIGVAQRFAREQNCTVLLKGAASVIAAAGGEVFISPTGNPGLASGGTGDVLAGLVTAQLGQRLPGAHAAAASAFVHGLAGDRRARTEGERGLTASSVATGIGEVWAEWGL
jgi:NAD(P)H-hydrate epimerase